jgi:hypothetical protein
MKRTRTMEDILGPAPPKRPGRKPGDGGRAANPHRDAVYIQQERVTRLKADQLEGKLLLAADVERQWTAAIVDFRQRLLALPSRIGARHGLTRKQIADLDAEIRATLTALAASGGKLDDGGPSTP